MLRRLRHEEIAERVAGRLGRHASDGARAIGVPIAVPPKFVYAVVASAEHNVLNTLGSNAELLGILGIQRASQGIRMGDSNPWLDAFLEKAADLLRGGVDPSEFLGYVFALLRQARMSSRWRRL
jgi:hypothetical protein